MDIGNSVTDMCSVNSSSTVKSDLRIPENCTFLRSCNERPSSFQDLSSISHSTKTNSFPVIETDENSYRKKSSLSKGGSNNCFVTTHHSPFNKASKMKNDGIKVLHPVRKSSGDITGNKGYLSMNCLISEQDYNDIFKPSVSSKKPKITFKDSESTMDIDVVKNTSDQALQTKLIFGRSKCIKSGRDGNILICFDDNSNINESKKEEEDLTIKKSIGNFMSRYLWGNPVTSDTSTQVDPTLIENKFDKTKYQSNFSHIDFSKFSDELNSCEGEVKDQGQIKKKTIRLKDSSTQMNYDEFPTPGLRFKNEKNKYDINKKPIKMVDHFEKQDNNRVYPTTKNESTSMDFDEFVSFDKKSETCNKHKNDIKDSEKDCCNGPAGILMNHDSENKKPSKQGKVKIAGFEEYNYETNCRSSTSSDENLNNRCTKDIFLHVADDDNNVSLKEESSEENISYLSDSQSTIDSNTTRDQNTSDESLNSSSQDSLHDREPINLTRHGQINAFENSGKNRDK
ncbi:uncharacterized protein LOC142320883 [Lycorma delicatula]|uniref:uncharacterized protein LOC142320883 n=1 Tax=Lycorma delicatula TaxID=130591 RepID=UPI003F514A0D